MLFNFLCSFSGISCAILLRTRILNFNVSVVHLNEPHLISLETYVITYSKRHSTGNIQLQIWDYGTFSLVYYIPFFKSKEKMQRREKMGKGRKAERKTFSALLQETVDVIPCGLITTVLSSEHFCCRGVFRWEMAEGEWEAADVGFFWKLFLSSLKKNRYEERLKREWIKSWWKWSREGRRYGKGLCDSYRETRFIYFYS